MDFSFPVSAEDAQTLETILETLDRLQREDVHPFPYTDIWHIYKTVTSRKIRTRRAIDKGFIPDLAMYFADIYGCSGWGKKALKWDVEKRREFTRLLSQAFFDRHPEYVLIRRWITRENTPDLYHDFVLHEEMRVNVLVLIKLLDKLNDAT